MAVDLTKIKAFVFDVDGVFTDGGIYAINGDLLRRYDAKDCMSTRMAWMQGFKLGVITGGISQIIVQRMERCGFAPEDVYLGARKKVEQLDHFCAKYSLEYDQVLYCGDDLPDIPVMKACGVGAAPADAVTEVLEAADYVSKRTGGHGFVRDVVESTMRAQGKWILDDDHYKKAFEGK